MEEIGNSLNQSLADVFEVQSDTAKKRDKLNQQIQEGKKVLEKIKTISITEAANNSLIVDFLKIFYSKDEVHKQIIRLNKLNETQILTSLYSILTHRMDRYDKITDEIKEITGK